MSQISTLYRISKIKFENLKNSENRNELNLENNSKEYYDFNGSFLGLEFVLIKINRNKILSEIFNSNRALGQVEYDALDFEKQFKFYESGRLIPYLNPDLINRINEIITEISEKEFAENYSAEELNTNDIYPNVWNYDNSEDSAYNLIHLSQDFNGLKNIFKNAFDENDYILNVTV